MSSSVLLLLCKGAENDSSIKHRHSSSKCLSSLQDGSCYLQYLSQTGTPAHGTSMVKGKWGKGSDQGSFTAHIAFQTLHSAVLLQAQADG